MCIRRSSILIGTYLVVGTFALGLITVFIAHQVSEDSRSLTGQVSPMPCGVVGSPCGDDAICRRGTCGANGFCDFNIMNGCPAGQMCLTMANCGVMCPQGLVQEPLLNRCTQNQPGCQWYDPDGANGVFMNNCCCPAASSSASPPPPPPPPVVCGNGVREGAEECDDGNTQDSNDGCTNQCTIHICGDSIVAGPASPRPEQCDDGNTVAGDGCDTCVLEPDPCPISQSPIRKFFAQLFPNLIAVQGCARCCTPIGCIDMANTSDVVYQCETASQGGRFAGFGSCAQVPANYCAQVCGDVDVLNFGIDGIDEDGDGDDEECDDGNNANFDGCSASCKIECTSDASCLGEPSFNHPGWSCQSDDCQTCSCQSFKCISGIRQPPGPNCTGIGGATGGPFPIGGATGGPTGGTTGGATGTTGGASGGGDTGDTGGGDDGGGNSSTAVSSGGASSSPAASSTTVSSVASSPCTLSSQAMSQSVSRSRCSTTCADTCWDRYARCAGGCANNIGDTAIYSCLAFCENTYRACASHCTCSNASSAAAPVTPPCGSSSSAASCPSGQLVCSPMTEFACICGTQITFMGCAQGQKCFSCPACSSSSSSSGYCPGPVELLSDTCDDTCSPDATGKSCSTLCYREFQDTCGNNFVDPYHKSCECKNSLQHLECRDKACVIVPGAGENKCTQDMGCNVGMHTVCRDNECALAEGDGANECLSDDDCFNVSTSSSIVSSASVQSSAATTTSATTTSVSFSSATQASLSGGSSSSAGAQSSSIASAGGSSVVTAESSSVIIAQQSSSSQSLVTFAPPSSSAGAAGTHLVCNPDLTCGIAPGEGYDECDPAFGCGNDYHASCVGEKCKIVPGPGGIACREHADCVSPKTTDGAHLVCGADLSCQIAPGEGYDECDPAFGCGNDYHASCVSGKCKIIPGPGGITCREHADCGENPEKQCISDIDCTGSVCRNGKCGGPSLVAAAAVCGNGILDSGEECDDSNRTNNDGCSSVCTLEGVRAAAPASVCGNGIRESGEGCDSGPANSNFPGAPCRSTCVLPRCGDNVRDPNESCDDGNTTDKDGCDRYCRNESTLVASDTTQAVSGERVAVSDQKSAVSGQQFNNQQIPFPYAQLPTPYSQFPTPYALPYASLQPLIQQAPATTQSGPAAVAIIGAGAAAGLSWVRRKRK